MPVASPTPTPPRQQRTFSIQRDAAGVDQVYVTPWAGGGAVAVTTRGASDRRVFRGVVAPVGDVAYFSLGEELFVTDGTFEGTRAVPTGGVRVYPDTNTFSTVAGRVLFTGIDPDHGAELWAIDGTGEARLLVDLATGEDGRLALSSGTDLGDSTYFVKADDELWKSDGTVGGTARVALLPGRIVPPFVRSGPHIYWIVRSADSEEDQLWRTDGTAAGTIKLAAMAPVAIRALTAVGDGVVFTGPGDQAPRALWASSGLPTSTRRIADLPFENDTGTMTAREGGPYLTPVGSEAYFQYAGEGLAWRLWRTDGTADGTQSVPGVHSQDTARASVGGRLWFVRTTPRFGRQLWSTDATARGTRRETAVARGSGGLGKVRGLFAGRRGQVYFAAKRGREVWLWRTDGSRDGVQPLQVTGTPSDARPLARRMLVVVGAKLWATDGTRRGTRPVATLPSAPRSFTVDFDGSRYFEAPGDLDDEPHRIYRSDGTPRGTVEVSPVRDGRPVPSPTLLGAAPSTLILGGGTLLFALRR